MFIKKLFTAAARSGTAGGNAMPVEYPLETERRLVERHGRAPVDRHLDVLAGDLRIGSARFVDLYTDCLRQTGTAVTPFNVFQRYQTRQMMVQYFLATLEVAGARAECGAYRGATALLLCHAWKSRQPDFLGENMHLIDSFSGTSASVAQDYIPVREEGGSPRMAPFFPPGKTDVTPELVRGFLTGFPRARISAGWIPKVFASLPEQAWAFVHLDLTLYEPTLAAMEYFHPRLSSGGVIFADGSIFCPGAEKAVDDYCVRNGIPYVTLGHREMVIIR